MRRSIVLIGASSAYRIYESEADEPGVRVMITTAQRLQDLEDAIGGSRDWVLRDGPSLLHDR